MEQLFIIEYVLIALALLLGYLLGLWVRRDRRPVGHVLFRKGKRGNWYWTGEREDGKDLVQIPVGNRQPTMLKARDDAREALVKTRWVL